MKKTILKLCAILVVILIFALVPIGAAADFGDFSGGDDYGYDDYDYDDYDYDYYDDDDDNYYGGTGSGGGNSEGSTEIASIIVAAIVFMIVFIYPQRRGSKRTRDRNRPGQSPLPPGATPTTGLWPMDTIKRWDPNFSDAAMKERIANLYVQMQNCWTTKDITPLRGDFTDVQFAQYDNQLDRYRSEGITNMIERIAVLDVTLVGVMQDEKNDILIANLYTRITTYSIKDETGEIIKGNKDEEKFMRYEWTLVRPRGSQTKVGNENGTETFNCPNCGAPLNINKTALCPYCNSVVSKPNYDWVISGIKGLSQRTK